MSVTAKKVPTDGLARAFDEAEDGASLSDEDRAALVEATADPVSVRMSRGDAFERIVCPDECPRSS